MGFRVIGTCSRHLGEFSPSRGENTGEENHHLGTCKGQLWTTSQRKKNSKPCILIGQIVSLCPSCSNRKTGHYRSAILSIVCFPQKSSTCLSTLPFLLAALRPARFPRLFRPSPSGWPRRSSPWSPACVPWDPSAPRSPKHRRWAELDEGVT